MSYYIEIFCDFGASSECSKNELISENAPQRTYVVRVARECEEQALAKGWRIINRGKLACPQCLETLQRRARIKRHVKKMVQQLKADEDARG